MRSWSWTTAAPTAHDGRWPGDATSATCACAATPASRRPERGPPSGRGRDRGADGRRRSGRSDRDPAHARAARRRLRPGDRPPGRPPGPGVEANGLEALQRHHRQGDRRRGPRLQQRPQDDDPGRRRLAGALRRAAPVHPGAGVLGRVPGLRGGGASPAAPPRRVQVRRAPAFGAGSSTWSRSSS